MVTAKGAGRLSWSRRPATAWVLHLAKDDVPIRGRVIDIQGRPVAGATIKVVGILRHPVRQSRRVAQRPQERKGRLPRPGPDAPLVVRATTSRRFSPRSRPTARGGSRSRASAASGSPRCSSAVRASRRGFEYAVTRDMPAVKVAASIGRTPDATSRITAPRSTSWPAPGWRSSGRSATRIPASRWPASPCRPRRVRQSLPLLQDDHRARAVTGSRGSPKTDFGGEQDVLAAPKDGPPYVPTVQHVGDGTRARPDPHGLRAEARGPGARAGHRSSPPASRSGRASTITSSRIIRT